jgi:hypothetical protein
MHGEIFSFYLTKVILPGLWKCLVLAPPFLTVAALWWLINRTDRIITYLFPDLEWEKKLGWLNIKAERRAKMALRWVGYGFYFVLLIALGGILWGGAGFPSLDNWSDPLVMGDLALRVPVIVFCLGLWVLYLGCGLMPKLRALREEAALKKFRREMAEVERAREAQPVSRIHSPLRKPRTNAPLESVAPDRTRKRPQPGG